MLWTKLGEGIADVEVFMEVLSRAGLPTTPPPDNWALVNKVRALYYVPKNKPFLIGEESLPEGAQALLDLWPAGGLMVRWLLQALHPCLDPRYSSPDVMGGCYGCKTDEIEDFGQVYSSKTNTPGFVEGIVSSLANWKLYSLPLRHFDWSSEFLSTPKKSRFSSPLRPAERVPAGTVIHTAYCSAHLLEWYDHVLTAQPETFGAKYRAGILRERIERGLPQLEAVFPEATTEGKELLEGIVTWSTRLLAQKGPK